MLKGFKGRKTGHNGHFHGIPALFQGLEGRLIAQKMCIENWNKIGYSARAQIMFMGFKGRKTGQNGHFHGIPALFQ